ncbi:MAG: hypothetical protein VB034_04670 [Eubacteriales bacterium]|nr:hypothetical protein [Eubacteriales bacterium]
METIERKEFEGQKRLCDERFKRDKEDIQDSKASLEDLTRLVTEMAAMQKQSMAQTADQETRIRALESRGGAWLDRIISLVLGALIAYLASIVLK